MTPGAHYETHQLADKTPSDVAWIGSTQLAGIYFFGVFAGYLFDAGYYRPVFMTGSVLMVVG